VRHRRDEGVTSPGIIGDVAPAGTAIAERFAQRRNMNPKGGLFDDRVGPNPRDQLFFRDCIAGALDEGDQNVERAAPEAQGLPVLEHPALRGDEPERSEGEDFFIHRGFAPRGFRNWYRPWRTFATPPVGIATRGVPLTSPHLAVASVHRRPSAANREAHAANIA
jgi:hypothetical protein